MRDYANLSLGHVFTVTLHHCKQNHAMSLVYIKKNCKLCILLIVIAPQLTLKFGWSSVTIVTKTKPL